MPSFAVVTTIGQEMQYQDQTGILIRANEEKIGMCIFHDELKLKAD